MNNKTDMHEDWLRDGSLLYRLTDSHKPQNRDEINITMTDGSRELEVRERRAKQLLEMLQSLAGQSAGVAEGWKLVPIEPTVEMLEAGARHIPALHVWTGMIAAASAPVSEPEQAKQSVPAPLSEYHEDTGPVVWWTWQDGLWLGEPAWIGTPTDSDWPGYHTHWTYHPEFPLQPLAEHPSERMEQDCPHGVDDGACKQCYGEAVRGEQVVAFNTAKHAENCLYVLSDSPFEPCTCDIGSPNNPAVAPTLGDDGYGDTDFGYTLFGVDLEDGDKRLMAMLVRALGTDHPAITDLVALIFRTQASQPQAAEPKGLTDDMILDEYSKHVIVNHCNGINVLSAMEPEGFIKGVRALLAKGE